MSANLLFLNDTHSALLGGLTPPDWQFSPKSRNPHRARVASMQRWAWDFFESVCDEVKPRAVICVGDLIDGKGTRSGGTELITADMEEQCEMAAQVIRRTGAVARHLVYGTPYHTGQDTDFEKVIAEMVGADIESHAFVEFEGVVFNVKHEVRGSAIPYGKATPLFRAALQDSLWMARGVYPAWDLLVRGHTHTYQDIRNVDLGRCIGLPCLAFGSKYGARRCEAPIDLGMVSIEAEDGWYEPTFHELDMGFLAQKVVKL